MRFLQIFLDILDFFKVISLTIQQEIVEMYVNKTKHVYSLRNTKSISLKLLNHLDIYRAATFRKPDYSGLNNSSYFAYRHNLGGDFVGIFLGTQACHQERWVLPTLPT